LLKKQLDRPVLAYSKLVLRVIDDEPHAYLALMALILLACVVVQDIAYVILLAFIGVGIFNALSYYFMHDKTQEVGFRDITMWLFYASAIGALIFAPLLSVLQVLWLVKFS
jgi:hypothetical protein